MDSPATAPGNGRSMAMARRKEASAMRSPAIGGGIEAGLVVETEVEAGIFVRL